MASALFIAEVTKLRGLEESEGTSIEEQAKLIRPFFENDYIKVRSVDRRIAESAAAICRDYRLKPPGAVHVATALRWNCKSFQTCDGENGEPRKLLAFDGQIGSPPLKIELPRLLMDKQGKLFCTPPATQLSPC